MQYRFPCAFRLPLTHQAHHWKHQIEFSNSEATHRFHDYKTRREQIHSELGVRDVAYTREPPPPELVPHVHAPAWHWQLFHSQQAGCEQLDGQYSLGTAGARVVAAVVRVDGIRIELRDNVCEIVI